MHDAPAARREQVDGVAQEAVRRRRRAIADRRAGSACRCRRRRSCPAPHRSAHAAPRRRRNGRPSAWLCGIAMPPSITVLPGPKPARRSPRRCAFHRRCLRARSSAVVILRLSSWPSTMTTLQSGALGDRGIVGEGRRLVAPSAAAARCAFEQRGIAEDLRRLRPPQTGARHRFGDRARGIDPLQRVGDRHAQHGAVDRRCRRASRQAAISARRTKGRAASWMATRSGGRAGQRFQAVQHRLLPAARRPSTGGGRSSPSMAAW